MRSPHTKKNASPYRHRAVLAMVLSVALGLIAFAQPASAIYSHATAGVPDVEHEFDIGPCDRIQDVDVDENGGYLYVTCLLPQDNQAAIRKFDIDTGQPANFTHTGFYLNDNEIIKSPTNTGFGNQLGFPRISIDNSGGPHQGYLFVVQGSGGQFYGANGTLGIDIFKPSGEFTAYIPQEYPFLEHNVDVEVLPNGNILKLQAGAGAGGPSDNPDPMLGNHVTEYDTSFHSVRRLYYLTWADIVRADSQGSIWLKVLRSSNNYRLSKYEPDQWSFNLSLSGSVLNYGDLPFFLQEKAEPSPLFSDPFFEGTWPGTEAGNEGNFDIDLNRDDLYVNRGNKVEVFSGGDVEEAPHQVAPPVGEGVLSGTRGIAVTLDNRLFVSSGPEKVVEFGPGDILPDIRTAKPDVDEIGHTSATVRGHIELGGGSPISECEVSYSGPTSGIVPCAPDPSGGNFAVDTDVSASLSGLTEGGTYAYQIHASNAQGENAGIARTVTPAYVLRLKTLAPSHVDDHAVTLSGSFEPDLPTSYHFEYGVDQSYGLETPTDSRPATGGVVPVAADLTSLPAGRTFHYRIVASNANGTTVGEDRTFRTAAAPDIKGVFASDVMANTATLNASVDPTGYATTYQFEYGPTPDYGSSVPLSPEGVGAGEESVDVSRPVSGLREDVTYHFRVVATNQWGSSASPDTTFDFAPPSCPNAHVRQEMRSSYLPDCRAYELVSPADASAIHLVPSQNAWDKQISEVDPYGQGEGWAWPVNTGLATSPARFAYFGGFGSVPGIDAPNSSKATDMYVATRTPTGWTTTLPGFTGTEVLETGRKECSETLSLCSDHDEGAALYPVPNVTAPSLFTVGGTKLGQFPSNVDIIPNGENFSGPERWSADFSHFAFSSTNAAFAPGGQTGGVGSAYLNDVANSTVELISKLPGGAAIPANGSSRGIAYPGMSADGSHLVMETQVTPTGPFWLYVRGKGGLTYDIGKGAPARFVGMTRDGERVLFFSDAKLSPDDTDASSDLYMWTEDGDSLTRLSQGNGNGDQDNCNASWTQDCDVEPLSTERIHPHGLRSVPGFDDLIAEQTGDVYFYSPENLDPDRPGIRNQRNLYVYRDGSVRLVATLDQGTQVNRMQISPDGSHAGILTASRLTSYDNDGFRQMYAYNAEARHLACASCNPTGAPPVASVTASGGGPFMADDGRLFFATKDALVQRDTNARIIDVYEYVDGRPQLITSGMGSRDTTGGSQQSSLFTLTLDIGLESVSANGADVYFSTYETLTPGDLNGPRLKFYDARTGGGFPTIADLAPCAAADECHGTDSAPPGAAVIGTGGNLGAGGNHQATSFKPKKKHRKRKRAGRKRRIHRTTSREGRSHG